MGLFSFLRKDKQVLSIDEGSFYSKADEESKSVRARGQRGATTATGARGQTREPVDPVLPEKKRARRRLVGAIALILAVIIGLPMILDSEPKPIASDIPILIPAKDKPVSVTQMESSSAPRANEIASSEVGAPKVAESASIGNADSNTISAATEAQPAANNAAVVKPTAEPSIKPAKLPAIKNASPDTVLNDAEIKPTPKIKPSPKTDAKLEKEAVANAEVSSADAARANAILEGKIASLPDVTDTAAPPSKFVVQVAALATRDKVDELQGKLKDAGIKSYTQTVSTQSGTRIRVRIGPFGDKDEALKMREKLAKIGLNGTLIPA
ncbi:MAG: SPOR domain-containing protein [Pseudomonadota bacterium]